MFANEIIRLEARSTVQVDVKDAENDSPYF
jgi:hypothetical protein